MSNNYEAACNSYAERAELEALNRKTDENLARMQQTMWEQKKKAEEERFLQDRKIQAVINMVAMIFLSVTICVALGVLAYTGDVAYWISGVLIVCVMTACTFRTGYLWHEIEN